jgi:hypothetical protein
VGSIDDNTEKLQLNGNGHLCAMYKKSKLTQIANRKTNGKTNGHTPSRVSPFPTTGRRVCAQSRFTLQFAMKA